MVISYQTKTISDGGEIQEPRRKNILIDYERLQGLIGARSYEELRSSHKGWIEEYLGEGLKFRQEEWTRSIAVGSRSFIEKVKKVWSIRAKGRDVIGGNEGYQLRDGYAPYKGLFGAGKDDIGPENTYFWGINNE